MAHYAFLNTYNIVTEVITGVEEGSDGQDWEVKYGQMRGQTCKRRVIILLGELIG